MKDHQASDLYLTVGSPPMLRTEESMIPYTDKTLTYEDLQDIITSVLTTRQRREYDTKLELNTALDMGEFGRFRVNVLRQRQAPALVIRRVISVIPSFTDLRLPMVLEKLSMEKRGLVLVCGMTGSGKSTTLASMIDYRNANSRGHIITIEDPIEFFHEHKNCVVTQREVGVDTETFSNAIKNSLRQRPDVIQVGEIRDRDVMQQALAIAETGHLCLATLHTNNSYQAIERIVNLFPEEQGNQIRQNLSMNLKAIISQRLLPSKENKLAPAIEVMINEGLVRELILKGHMAKVKEIMEQNNANGMCTFDQSILALYQRGIIDQETAILHADKQSDMKILLKQADLIEDEDKGKTLTQVDTSLITLAD